ncbi:MAG TPA: hypothetical protein VHO50_05480 [Bacteroidales bacterium]|nr:hypothetical protein [Bacteroidales bacterium]
MSKKEILNSGIIGEIMGSPPSIIVRSGTLILFLMLVLFILLASLIRYPDTIPTKVEITTTNPPITVISKITGRIQRLMVSDKELVNPGQILAVMETSASIEDILTIRRIFDTMSISNSPALPDLTDLGEIQTFYSDCKRNLNNLESYDRNNYYGAKIKSVNDEINAIKDYIEKIIVKESIFSEDLKIEASKFRRDSMLFVAKVIPASQLEITHQSYLKTRLDLQQSRLDRASKLIELAEKKHFLQEYSIKMTEERELLFSAYEESFLNLKAQLNIWVNTYFLTSDINGIVTFTKYWSVNQSVLKDEPVMNVVPLDIGHFIGRSKLKMHRSGKVNEGQIVNIKLSGYPYLEYGIVRGIVKSKSLVPSDNEYIIEIELPEGLRTIYGFNLEFTQNMQGVAEIITDDASLIQKIFNPFRYLITKNRRQLLA